eukprot:TRINITY_DN3281_c0_g3_i1.p1 TRINITY_DN3281_c0_g3~~TRINITY_DN3281_c0_g3_i1.p1  ORF type:complete len:349 (+),score=111.70 TRINITY_DN3281_c0_g3_i1:38-1084(+)
MPPKNSTLNKQKQKKIEEDIRRLKGKKNKKAKDAIRNLQYELNGGKNEYELRAEKKAKKDQQKEQKKMEKKKVVNKAEPVGENAKGYLCPFIAQGQTCPDGDNCPYRHEETKKQKDKNKASIYVDQREMDRTKSSSWSADLIKQVANSQYRSKNATAQSQKSCPHFMKSVENGTFGWFWECPNGQKCMFKHAVPEGWRPPLQQEADDDEGEFGFYDIIEAERAKFIDGIGVNEETFKEWKEKRLELIRKRKIKEVKEEVKKLKRGQKARVSGRVFFLLDIGDKEDDKRAGDNIDYKHREEDEEENDEENNDEIESNDDLEATNDVKEENSSLNIEMNIDEPKSIVQEA